MGVIPDLKGRVSVAVEHLSTGQRLSHSPISDQDFSGSADCHGGTFRLTSRDELRGRVP